MRLGTLNQRFVASPFKLGLVICNLQLAVWPFEFGLGTLNPRFVAWLFELGLGIINPPNTAKKTTQRRPLQHRPAPNSKAGAPTQHGTQRNTQHANTWPRTTDRDQGGRKADKHYSTEGRGGLQKAKTTKHR